MKMKLDKIQRNSYAGLYYTGPVSYRRERAV